MIPLSGQILELLHRLGRIVRPEKSHGVHAMSRRHRLRYLQTGILEFAAADARMSIRSRFPVEPSNDEWDVSISAEKWNRTSELIPRSTHRASVEAGVLTLKSRQHSLRYKVGEDVGIYEPPSLDDCGSPAELDAAGLEKALEWIGKSHGSRAKLGCRVNQSTLFQSGLAFRTSGSMLWSVQTGLEPLDDLNLEPKDAARVAAWLAATQRGRSSVSSQVAVRKGLLYGVPWYAFSTSGSTHQLWVAASQEPVRAEIVRSLENAERRGKRMVKRIELLAAINDLAGLGRDIDLQVCRAGDRELLELKTGPDAPSSVATLQLLAQQSDSEPFPTIRVASRHLLDAIGSWPDDDAILVTVYAGVFPMRLQSVQPTERTSPEFREILMAGSTRMNE